MEEQKHKRRVRYSGKYPKKFEEKYKEHNPEKYADTVRDFVINKTKLNPVAFKVIVIEEIPKNDAGKTLYKELTKYYEE